MTVAFAQRRPPKIPTRSLSGQSYEHLWDIAAACWATNPLIRPLMTDLNWRLQAGTSMSVPPVLVSPSMFVATAWAGSSSRGSGVRVYYPFNGGIQELVCSNGGLAINGSQVWIRGAFLRNTDYAVPDNAPIAVTNTFENPSLKHRRITVVFSDDAGYVRTWDYLATTGQWREANFEHSIPQCDGAIAIASCISTSKQYLFVRNASGRIYELDRQPSTLRWKASGGPSDNVYPSGITLEANCHQSSGTGHENERYTRTLKVLGYQHRILNLGSLDMDRNQAEQPYSFSPHCPLAELVLPGGKKRVYTDGECDGDLIEWSVERVSRESPTISFGAGGPFDITNWPAREELTVRKGQRSSLTLQGMF